MKKGFLLYNDLYESIENLSNEDKGQIFDAILRYSNEKEISEMSPIAKTAFGFIKLSLDRDNQRYEEICSKNKENIKKRWSKNNNTTVYDRIRTDTKHTNINININKDINNNINKYISSFNEKFKTNYQITTDRTKKLNLRLKTFSLEEILNALDNLSKSEFHQGKNDRSWKADPDFLIRNDEQIDKWLNNKPVNNLLKGTQNYADIKSNL